MFLQEEFWSQGVWLVSLDALARVALILVYSFTSNYSLTLGLTKVKNIRVCICILFSDTYVFSEVIFKT